MSPRKRLSPASEDYLEAILRLSGENGVARVRDIAGELGLAPSTVSGALKGLAERDLVNYRPYEVITLTPTGEQIGRRTSRRHEFLARFFGEVLGVAKETANADACRLEHGLSRETVNRLTAFMEFLEDCPRVGPDWAERFHERCQGKLKSHNCLRCIEGWLPGVREKLSGRRRRPKKTAK